MKTNLTPDVVWSHSKWAGRDINMEGGTTHIDTVQASFPSTTLNKMFQVDSLNRKTNLNFDRFTRVHYTNQITNILLKANVNQTAVGKAATNP